MVFPGHMQRSGDCVLTRRRRGTGRPTNGNWRRPAGHLTMRPMNSRNRCAYVLTSVADTFTASHVRCLSDFSLCSILHRRASQQHICTIQIHIAVERTTARLSQVSVQFPTTDLWRTYTTPNDIITRVVHLLPFSQRVMLQDVDDSHQVHQGMKRANMNTAQILKTTTNRAAN